MNITDKQIQLKQIIRDSLTPLIDKDYVLLDLPYHENVGDTLIWEGERNFLKEINHKCLYQASLDTYDVKKISKTNIILFNGGGNFGDLWKDAHNFRKKVIGQFSQNKCIIFPQSLYYEDEKNLENDIQFFRDHPNVIMCFRDSNSYDIAKQTFTNNLVLLVPDMAFFCRCSLNNDFKSNKILYLKRKDKEYSDVKIDFLKGREYETCDWPYSEKIPWIYIQLHRLEVLYGIIDKMLGTNIKVRLRNFHWIYILRNVNIRTAYDFIDKYSDIYTTRLHVAILGALMGKNITILDNKNGKVRNLYHTWLEDLNNITISNQ